MAEQQEFDAMPERVPDEVERAARALYDRDAARSIALAGRGYVWPRVAREYRAAARAALTAAGEVDDGEA